MARLPLAKRRRNMGAAYFFWLQMFHVTYLFFLMICRVILLHRESHCRPINDVSRFYRRTEHLNRLIYTDDTSCIEQLRLNTHTFTVLCNMVSTLGRLSPKKNMNIDEQVAMFLHILAHHAKNRVIKFKFMRFRETVSRHFHNILHVVIRLHGELLKQPEPVPANSIDPKWKWFKNCLGALDGTYIKVHVLEEDKPRHRTRKNEIAMNVLAVCSQDMQFIYVLPGWEGSAADGRVLHDAIRRRNGLRVTHGHYYLVDAGYTNGDRFLAPYRGQRYHLNDWREGHVPNSPHELFNMKHSAARTIIERCFGLLKLRWAILRSPSFYPIKTQNCIVTACCLLHNMIKREMPVDPFEELLDVQGPQNDGDQGTPIMSIEPSDEWSAWRDNLANEMFNQWRAGT